MSHSSHQAGSIVNAKSIINEVDLKKKKLESQIQQLERQLKKQEKCEQMERTQKQLRTNRVTMHSPTSRNLNSPGNANKSPRSQLSTHTASKKEVRPGISQNWKKIFKIEPIVSDPRIRGDRNDEIMEQWHPPHPMDYQSIISRQVLAEEFQEYQDVHSFHLFD